MLGGLDLPPLRRHGGRGGVSRRAAPVLFLSQRQSPAVNVLSFLLVPFRQSLPHVPLFARTRQREATAGLIAHHHKTMKAMLAVADVLNGRDELARSRRQHSEVKLADIIRLDRSNALKDRFHRQATRNQFLYPNQLLLFRQAVALKGEQLL